MDHASRHLSSPNPTSQFLFSTHSDRQLPPSSYKASSSSPSSSSKSPPTSPPPLELPIHQDDHNNNNTSSTTTSSQHNNRRSPLTPLLSLTPDAVIGCYEPTDHSEGGSSLNAQQNQLHERNEDDHLFANNETNCNNDNHDNEEHNQSLETSKVDNDYNNNDLNNDINNNQQNQSLSRTTSTDLVSANTTGHTTTTSLMNDDTKSVHHCPIDRGSLADVDDDVDDDDDDDDGGMHNMLSGSSSSSASTLPLLTESHSHHSFSRISLGEYSPLSLVEDCDNALPISPTSLACSAHSSFKTSLNGLKMDNLDVGVGHVDHDGVHDVDVNDTRSLSPSILSSSNNNHHNLWLNSSTAITQNTSLLNGTSTSFLLSHHHQHQLSSLLQHLEPQSMDEPLISSHNNSQNISGSSADGYILAPTSLASASIATTTAALNSSMHRPSSEPPPGLELSEIRSSHIKTKQSIAIAGSNVPKSSSSNTTTAIGRGAKVADDERASATTTLTRTSRRSRSRSNPAKQNSTVNSGSKASNDGTSTKSNINNDTHAKSNLHDSSQCYETVHDSKLHLQLNHHKKLKELQQRLFGDLDVSAQQKSVADSIASSDSNTTVISDSVQQIYDKESVDNSRVSKPTATITTRQRSISQASSSAQSVSSFGVKQEPDSQSVSNNNVNSNKRNATQNVDTKQQQVSAESARPATRTRYTRNRRRAASSTKSSDISTKPADEAVHQNINDTQSGSDKDATAGDGKAPQKTVKTEKAEPDTTTKSSDYIKLADLLSNNSERGSNFGLVVNDSSLEGGSSSVGTSDTNGCSSNRVQQIQLQVSPSLTVVANGGLMHSVGIGQHQQPQQQNQQQQAAGTVITSTCGSSIANQILCRPHAVISSNSGQVKNLVTGNDLINMSNTIVSGGSTININGTPTTVLPNWSLHTNNNTSSSATSQTIGAHQIAIQVICQDGTSLVLPVSSAAGLNAAVSLTSQHPQLQAVLSNNSISGTTATIAPVNIMQQQLHCNQGQMLHGMSVSNIVTQQQQQLQVEGHLVNGISNNSTTTTNGTSMTTSGGQTTQTATSGLAASSPTLAALLDAGSNRSVVSSNDLVGCGISGQNLLRKLVSGGNSSVTLGNDLNLSGEVGNIAQASSNANNTTSINLKTPAKNSSTLKLASGEKRLKLDGNDNLQASFTLVNPDITEVTNNKSNKQLTENGSIRNDNNASANSASTHSQQANKDTSTNAKQAKNNQGSSTGNRQVDPTQPFRCEHCNSTFTRLGNFTRHKKIHTVPTKDGQRFKCDVCSKSFLQRCDLARHLHIHRGTEPHRCNICGKGYIRHSDLVTHQRFHNKEKPFGCPHCSKGFCQRGDLNRHLRSIHLQMKPILCPCCNRKFAKQETLLRHLNTAHRGKPGTASSSTISATSDTPANCSSDNQSDDRQASISVVTSQSMTNNNNTTINNDSNNNVQKNSPAPVASLQAIRATLCHVQQPLDASTNSGLRNTPPRDQITTAKAVS